jgi:hypothetical protein
MGIDRILHAVILILRNDRQRLPAYASLRVLTSWFHLTCPSFSSSTTVLATQPRGILYRQLTQRRNVTMLLHRRWLLTMCDADGSKAALQLALSRCVLPQGRGHHRGRLLRTRAVSLGPNLYAFLWLTRHHSKSRACIMCDAWDTAHQIRPSLHQLYSEA